MAKRTKKQIDAQIKQLRKIRPRLKPFSIFGSDNIAQLDAVVDVLANDLDADEISDKYLRPDTEEEIFMAASETRNWLDGESDDKPAEGWPIL